MNLNFRWPPLVGCLIVLIVLFLWKITYPFTCFAWLFPTIIFVAIVYGQFEYFMRYRKCRADCLFQKSSWIYFWMTKKFMVMLYSVLIATPLTLSLASFVALANVADAFFMMLATGITLLSYPILFQALQKHVAQGMLIIITKRTVVILNMLIMLIIYSLISYFDISIPVYLDPSSLENTVDAASQAVGSVCSTSNYFLKFMQEIDAIGWYGMLAVNQSVKSEQIIQLLWALFFINHAIVFAALSRSQVEVMKTMEKLSGMPKRDINND